MANLDQAKKAIRSSARKRVFNDARRREMKKAVKEIKDLLQKKEVKKAEELMPTAYKAIDKALKRGVIKKNTAARKKSRLSKLIVKSK